MSKPLEWMKAVGRILPGSANRQALAEHEATRLCGAGEPEDAIRYCAAAVVDWPRSGRLQYLLGDCHFMQGNYALAAGHFSTAKRLSGDYPLVLYADLNHALALSRSEEGMALELPPPKPATIPFVSIIICSADDRKFKTVSSAYSSLFEAVPHEIIRIGDARSLTEGYNRGMDRSRGELLVFSHDDVRPVNTDFAFRLIAHMEHCELLGVAGTTSLCGAGWTMAGWPFLAGQVGMDGSEQGSIAVTSYAHAQASLVAGMQALDGLLLAARRGVAMKHRFDADTFDGWHMYDLDFSFRVAKAGHVVAVANDLLVVHNSPGGYRSPDWREYERRFLGKFAGRLEARNEPHSAELCAVTVDSAQEWVRMTAARLGGRVSKSV